MESFLSYEEVGALLLLALSPWILFALFSAFADSVVGFVDEWMLTELQTEKTSVNAPGKLVLLSGLFGFLVSAVAVAVALIHPEYFLDLTFAALGFSFLAGLIEVLWLIPYFYALHRAGVIAATPLLQAVPVFSLLFGLVIFSEVPNLVHISATACIITGALALNYSKDLKTLDKKTILLMFSTAALISIGLFLFKESESAGNFITSVFGNGLGMGITSAAIWISYKPFRLQFHQFLATCDRRILLGQLGNETLYGAGALAGQLAIVMGPSVMVVSAFNAFHPIFTLCIGWILTKVGVTAQEKRLKRNELILKCLGIFGISLGAVLIVF